MIGRPTVYFITRYTMLTRPRHQHEPDFLRNINIKKIKGRLQVSYYIRLLTIKLFIFSILLVHLFSYRKLQLEGKAAKDNRFDFDPRALEDRRVKRIEDLDLNRLRGAFDSRAEILKFSRSE